MRQAEGRRLAREPQQPRGMPHSQRQAANPQQPGGNASPTNDRPPSGAVERPDAPDAERFAATVEDEQGGQRTPLGDRSNLATGADGSVNKLNRQPNAKEERATATRTSGA